MHKNIDSRTIADMAGALENHELGAAIRILTDMLERKRPIAPERAPIIARMARDAWAESESAILEFFVRDADGLISHALLHADLLPVAERVSTPRVGRTGDLPLVSGVKSVGKNPTFIDRNQPARVSIKATAFQIMETLFSRANLSANSARSVLGSLLATWPEGDVYNAISAADAQQFVANPQPWITQYLKNHSTPKAGRRGGEHGQSANKKSAIFPMAGPIATPERMGVSEQTEARLAEKRRNLRIDIGASVPAPGAKVNS